MYLDSNTVLPYQIVSKLIYAMLLIRKHKENDRFTNTISHFLTWCNKFITCSSKEGKKSITLYCWLKGDIDYVGALNGDNKSGDSISYEQGVARALHVGHF